MTSRSFLSGSAPFFSAPGYRFLWKSCWEPRAALLFFGCRGWKRPRLFFGSESAPTFDSLAPAPHPWPQEWNVLLEILVSISDINKINCGQIFHILQDFYADFVEQLLIRKSRLQILYLPSATRMKYTTWNFGVDFRYTKAKIMNGSQIFHITDFLCRFCHALAHI